MASSSGNIVEISGNINPITGKPFSSIPSVSPNSSTTPTTTNSADTTPAPVSSPAPASTPAPAPRLSTEEKANQVVNPAPTSSGNAPAAKPSNSNNTGAGNENNDTTPSSPVPVNPTDPSSTTAPNQSSQSKVSLTPILNPLNQYDQVTYSIRFSMISSNSNNTNEVVIAETGKTNLNITSLKLNSSPALSPESRNTLVDTFELKIFEPYGANLPDMFLVAAKMLVNDNYMKGLWKITIKFQGYDAATGLPKVNIIDRDWSWTVMLGLLKTKVDEKGSTHVLTLVPKNQTGFSDQYAITTEAITVPREKESTVGDILHNVIDQMNANANKKFNGDRVTFQVDQIPYTYITAGVKAPFDHKVGPSQPTVESTRNSNQATIGTRTFMDIVNSLMASSETAAKMALAAARQKDNKETNNLDVVSTFHTVNCEVTLGEYLPQIGDWKRVIKYIIVPFQSVRLITNTEQARNIDDQKKNIEKASFLTKNNYLNKVYDYIFTGTNTEVLKFDIDLEFQWLMTMDNNFGQTTYGSVTTGQQYNQLQKSAAVSGQNNLTPLVNSTSLKPTTPNNNVTSVVNNPQASNGLQVTQQEGAAINAGKTADAVAANAGRELSPQEAAASLEGRAAAHTAENRLALAMSGSPVTVNNQQPTTQTSGSTASSSPLPARSSIPTKITSNSTSITYVDDLIYKGNQKFQIMPITQMQDSNTGDRSTVNGIIENDASRQRSAYGMLLNQLYNNGGSQNKLSNIHLSIRGDPYWLGRDSSDPIKAGPNPTNGVQTTNQYPAYHTGEIVFVLRFNLPQGFDENTGTVLLKQSEMYSGFYTCARIEHNFQDGIFTQTLEGTRILGMSVSDIINVNPGKN